MPYCSSRTSRNLYTFSKSVVILDQDFWLSPSLENVRQCNEISYRAIRASCCISRLRGSMPEVTGRVGFQGMLTLEPCCS